MNSIPLQVLRRIRAHIRTLGSTHPVHVEVVPSELFPLIPRPLWSPRGLVESCKGLHTWWEHPSTCSSTPPTPSPVGCCGSVRTRSSSWRTCCYRSCSRRSCSLEGLAAMISSDGRSSTRRAERWKGSLSKPKGKSWSPSYNLELNWCNSVLFFRANNDMLLVILNKKVLLLRS